MINLKDQIVLIIAPHPDDEVFGCGGLIHRVKREGGKVFVLYITVGTTKDFSKKGLSTKEERIKETDRVAKFLGYDGYRIAFPGDEYHLRLDTVAQKEIINEIERGKGISLESIKPTFVVTSSPFDYNQDHRAVNEAAITAMRPAPPLFKSLQPVVLTYEFPYSWTSEYVLPSPSFFVHLEKKDLDGKLKAVQLYKSQLKTPKGSLSVHAVKSLAHMRGHQSGVENAEAFFIKRLLI